MAKPMIRIHNVETDEIVDREMTDSEFNEWNKLRTIEQAKRDAEIAQVEARKSAIAKLAALGLTEDEIAAL